MPAIGERRDCGGNFSYNWHDSLCCDNCGVLATSQKVGGICKNVWTYGSRWGMTDGWTCPRGAIGSNDLGRPLGGPL